MKLKKIFLVITITVLYLLTPVSVIGILGTGVSLKYEVDEARIFADINHKKSVAEKEQIQKAIDKREMELNRTLYLWSIGLIAFPVTATALLIFRKRII